MFSAVPTHHDTYHPADYEPPEGIMGVVGRYPPHDAPQPARDTKPELAIRREMHHRGLRYRVATRPIKGVRRSADVVFTRARVAVFVDGCFWHRCPAHFRDASYQHRVLGAQDRCERGARPHL